jgi:PAS domain S-box-containing protein
MPTTPFSPPATFQKKLSSENVLRITKVDSTYFLGEHCAVLSDPESELSLDDVAVASPERAFQPLNERHPGVTAINGAYWLRCRIESFVHADIPWILEIAPFVVDSVTVYCFSPTMKSWVSYNAGSAGSANALLQDNSNSNSNGNGNYRDKYSFNGLNALRSAVRLPELQPGETVVCYIRIKTLLPFRAHLLVSTSDVFIMRQQWSFLLLGILYGIMVYACGYSFVVAASSRSRSQLYFALYGLSTLVFLLITDGFAVVVSRRSIGFDRELLMLTNTLATIFMTVSSCYLLRTKDHTPRLHRIIIAESVVRVLTFVFIMWSGASSLWLYFSLTGNIGLLMVAAGFAYKHGYTPARMYLVAWLITGAFLGYLALNVFTGIGFSAFWTPRLLNIALALKIILFSFVLAGELRFKQRQLEIENEQAIGQAAEARVETERSFELQRMYIELTAQSEELERGRAVLEKRTDELALTNRDLRIVNERNTLWEMVIRTMSEGLIVTNGAGVVEFVNVALENLTGYVSAELVGTKPGHMLQGAKTDALTVQYMRECFAANVQFSVELLNYTKSGREYWVRLNIMPMLALDGTLERYFAVQTDITADKEREERARTQSRLSTQRLIDSLRDLVVLIDMSLRLVQFNKPAYEAMKAINPTVEPAIGVDARLFSPVPLDLLQSNWEDVLAEKGKSFEYTRPHPLRPADPVWFTIHFDPVLDVDGKVIGVAFIVQNITRKKREQLQLEHINQWLEERVNARTSELEQANVRVQEQNSTLQQMNKQMQQMIDDVRRVNDEKSEIMGIVAHDLKNPITSIQGVAEALLDHIGRGDTMIHAFTSEILKTSQRMFALVKNLLDVNAIENGALLLSISTMDARLYVEAAVEKYKHSAAQKNITIISTMPESEAMILADELALIQVLDNLLSNAIKYSSYGARVWITVTALFHRTRNPAYTSLFGTRDPA